MLFYLVFGHWTDRQKVILQPTHLCHHKVQHRIGFDGVSFHTYNSFAAYNYQATRIVTYIVTSFAPTKVSLQCKASEIQTACLPDVQYFCLSYMCELFLIILTQNPTYIHRNQEKK